VHVANCGAASTATARAATRRVDSIFVDSILGGLGTRDESAVSERATSREPMGADFRLVVDDGFSFGCRRRYDANARDAARATKE
jgi:hypothetical protein